MKQTTLFEGGILPQPQSKIDDFVPEELKPKPYFVMKKLSEKALDWLENSLTTNWSQMKSKQYYTTKKKILKVLTWTLLGLDEPRDYCGNWISKGCFNTSMHPRHLPFVRRSKRSCFRANCQKCWLEKWLARESSRATRRIEKYSHMFQKKGWRYKNPTHIIFSPSWKDKELDYGELKQKVISLLDELGIRGGMMIHHRYKFDKIQRMWKVNTHFHIIGFGWLDVNLFQNMLKNKDSVNGKSYEGWVVKNLGLRKSLHSTVYYQLSHVSFAKGVQSVTWFGELSYRSKYSKEIKVEKEKDIEFCPFCGFFLVDCEFKGKGEPTPFEFEGSVLEKNWYALETVDQAITRKEVETERLKEKYQKKSDVNPYYNSDVMETNSQVQKEVLFLEITARLGSSVGHNNFMVEVDVWFKHFIGVLNSPLLEVMPNIKNLAFGN